MKRLVDLAGFAVVLGLAGAALVPTVDRALARRRVVHEVQDLAWRPSTALSLGMGGLGARPPLATWASVGGCGAGGGAASAAGGGIQWIGRNVTGGLLDAQVLTTHTYAQGNQFTAVAARFAVSPWPRVGVALNVPILHKAGEVAVLGLTKEARLAGFGDVSVEGSYKFGQVLSHQLMLIGIVPTGSADAVRQGVVLPQHLQLGSGVPGVVAQYQHTRDRDWGLIVAGGTVSYAGWENAIGDSRAPSATAYAHVGYLMGPWVPSAGITVFGKPIHDRERGADRPGRLDPLVMVVPSVGFEWSSQWIAVLPAATVGLSYNGFESVSFGLGLSSSLF